MLGWGKRNLFIASEATMEISMGVLQNIVYGPALLILSTQLKDSKLTRHTLTCHRDTCTSMFAAIQQAGNGISLGIF